MDRLNGLGSMFVSLESNTNLYHVGAVAVLDPSTTPDGTPPPVDAMRRVLEDRMDRLGPFHRRVVEAPAGIDHPRWVEEPPDLDRHLRRGALPAPGSDRELARFTADVLARPLDRRRPLWELHVVEGLEGGLVAGVAKIHHSAIDGIAGTEVTAQLMDLEPVPVPAEAPEALPPGEKRPNPLSLVRDAAMAAARRIVPTARFAGGLALRGLELRGRNRGELGLPPPAPFTAPRTPFNVPVGPERVVSFARVDRAEVDEVREVTGATVNDVILFLAGTALRRYLAERADLPAEPLVAFVPRNARVDGDTLDTGVNRLSGMLVSLATDLPDPVARLVSVSESARVAKAQARTLGDDLFVRLADLGVPALLRPIGAAVRGLRLLERRPAFSVVVSSFPGAPVPLFCGGAEMVAYHPFGPVIDGAAVNITAMSYRDHIGFGILACRDAMPDAELLGHWFPEAMTELRKAVASAGRHG